MVIISNCRQHYKVAYVPIEQNSNLEKLENFSQNLKWEKVRKI